MKRHAGISRLKKRTLGLGNGVAFATADLTTYSLGRVVCVDWSWATLPCQLAGKLTAVSWRLICQACRDW